MINVIINSISIALDTEFGDGYEIYTEGIEQGLEEPCFFISCINPSSHQFFGKKYFSENSFCIQYFPETDNKQNECNSVAERMKWCLEYITVENDSYRGTKMKYEITDGVLHFFVDYDFYVYRVSNDDDTIETIESSITVKE